jgi:hypothetical protein
MDVGAPTTQVTDGAFEAGLSLSRYHRLLSRLVKSSDNLIGRGRNCSAWPALEDSPGCRRVTSASRCNPD